MTQRVIVADDHLLFSEGITKIINGFTNFEIVASAANGLDLLKLLNNNYKPDVLILDVCMPQLNGIQAGKQIRILHPHLKIIVCTMYHTKAIKEQINEFNPQGLISKSIDATQLETVLNLIVNGKTYFESSYEFTDSCANEILTSDDFHLLQKLTPREKEIISNVKQGLSSKEIADKLQLSVNTVNNHKANVFQKLGFNSVTELIKFAYEVKL